MNDYYPRFPNKIYGLNMEFIGLLMFYVSWALLLSNFRLINQVCK